MTDRDILRLNLMAAISLRQAADYMEAAGHTDRTVNIMKEFADRLTPQVEQDIDIEGENVIRFPTHKRS